MDTEGKSKAKKTTSSPSKGATNESAPKDTPLAQKDAQKKRSDSGGPKRKGGEGGVNPLVLVVGLAMLLSFLYLAWENSGNSGELVGQSGALEGGKMASSLKNWPFSVLEHHNEGTPAPKTPHEALNNKQH